MNNSKDEDFHNFLEKSIIEKINCLNLNKSEDDNNDLQILRDIESVRHKLTDTDEFILKISKMTTESSTHNLDYTKTLNLKENEFFKDGKAYQYKYQLLSDNISLSEVTTLKKFIKRLTKYNYVNNNEKIRSFIVHRIIDCRDTNFILQQDRELTYLLLHYFLRKYKPKNLAIIEKLISNVSVYDTRLLNMMMKYSFKNVSSKTGKLIIINKMLSSFIYFGVDLNRTTIYLIFKHVIFGKDIPNMKLHRFLAQYMKDKQIIDNKYVTSLLYEKLLKLYTIYRDPKIVSYKQNIDEEIRIIVGLIPKFNQLNLNDVTLSDIRRLFSTSKYNDEISFKRVFQMHLIENDWKFVWNTINTHRLLQSNSLPNMNKNKLLRKFPSLKYSNFGASFNNEFKFLGPLWASELCYYAIRTQNWELLVRIVNEFTDVKYLVFTNAFAALLKLNLEKSKLHFNEYLVIVKFLLHCSLKNKIKPFTRNDVIFKRFQAKIDSIFNTSFSSKNYTVWQQKLENAKLCSEMRDNPKFKLFDSLFTEKDRSISTVIFEEKDEASSSELFGDLITPNLSRVTEFEKRLFRKISELKILDTEEKAFIEYVKYAEFWDSRGIKIGDVKKYYYLGVGDSSENNFSVLCGQVDNLIDNNLKPICLETLDFKAIFNTKKGTQFIKPKLSLNNVLPTDWLRFPIQQTHREWIEDSILKGTSNKTLQSENKM
ncbi:hypothetical protein CANINC_004898 [Pichia inconspicua]|uniref:Uncharacterized protein n=1 Tax=Pichia inconspicua TaxID=52247 RepID=A0A4T0WWD6_9ASCO|nr:hypothetical protein CANINC_004898 [[Candida] inconspicua]